MGRGAFGDPDHLAEVSGAVVAETVWPQAIHGERLPHKSGERSVENQSNPQVGVRVKLPAAARFHSPACDRRKAKDEVLVKRSPPLVVDVESSNAAVVAVEHDAAGLE